ncbi:MAG TPA: hypothetical protein VJP77_04620 [Planctomycetota bacterium]|nr:hypothetical protein [Planctomycetota bacterium]
MTPKKRTRRSPEQMIQDLQSEIERLKQRQVARELKQSAAHKLALAVVKAIDKALAVAREEGESGLQHVLVDIREPLGNFLAERGIDLPRVRRPRGPRPKDS